MRKAILLLLMMLFALTASAQSKVDKNDPAIKPKGNADSFSPIEQRYASLTIQAAIIYKMGGPQPVANAGFALLDDDLKTILANVGIRGQGDLDVASCFGIAAKYGDACGWSQRDAIVMTEAIKAHVISDTKTDFNGIAQFPRVKVGTYYIFGYCETRKGFAVWNLRISIDRDGTVLLDQNNAAVAL